MKNFSLLSVSPKVNEDSRAKPSLCSQSNGTWGVLPDLSTLFVSDFISSLTLVNLFTERQTQLCIRAGDDGDGAGDRKGRMGRYSYWKSV